MSKVSGEYPRVITRGYSKRQKGVLPLFQKKTLAQDFLAFWICLFAYGKQKVVKLSFRLENLKNFLVQQLLWRRGSLSRPITHVSLIAFSLSIVLIGIIFGKTGVFSTSSAAARQTLITQLAAPDTGADQNVLAAAVTTDTEISQKPRDTVIDYEVQSGDTISTVAQKFNIDTSTILWVNNLTDANSVKPGQVLKILPVSGVSHTVASGDTIYSIADKYKANPQAIADFPFNNIGEDLKVQAGQVLIVPDGVPPSKPAPSKAPPRYVAQGQTPTSPVTPKADDRTEDQKQPGGALGFIWPVGGIITQYRTYYHTGIDIAGPTGTPVVAASGGTVTYAASDGSGYGWHIIIDHGNGYQTLYAHLSKLDVAKGQTVSKGELIGLRGSTGRSTGPHLHFEVRKGGAILNPMDFLP